MAQIVRFLAENPTTWATSDSRVEKNPVKFCIFGLHEQILSFLRSTHTNLKLEIETDSAYMLEGKCG